MSDDETDNVWNRRLGPFYTVSSGARLLGITEEEILRKAENLELLRIITADGVELFPSVQFHEGAVIDGVPEVLKVLQDGIDSPETWAFWLTARVRFDGDQERLTALEKLLAGHKEAVLLEATHDAWAWKQ